MMRDVVIAGAGPVGLFLACELRLAGLSVLVLEAAVDPGSPLKRLPFGMRGLSAPTLDAFYRRGLLDALVEQQSVRGKQPAAHWQQQARRPAGHFAGIQFFHDRVDASKWRYRLPSPAGTSLAVDMEQIESVLAARAEALGVEIRRGVGVEDVESWHGRDARANEAGDDRWDPRGRSFASDGPSTVGVTVHAGGERFRASWLVGCDGGRSTVRKKGGFEFVGTDPEFTGYSVEIELADPDSLRPGRHYTPTGMYTFTPPGTVAMVDFDGGAFHRTQPITPDHVQTVLRRVSGSDLTVKTVHLAATWTDRAYQATAYRKGRILLAGDAAHTHSPLGGQGLNLGLGDAMNLGWKLASTHRGDAPAGLLDTYFSERYPVGADVLDWSRAQVAIMRPRRSSRALEAIIRDLIETRDGATYFAERVSGVSLRYDIGGSHPLVGCSVPDFELANGKVGPLLRTGKGLLLDFDAAESMQRLATGWNDRLVYVAGDVEDRLGLAAVLVRPDGIVAWVSESTPSQQRAAPSLEEAANAISQWFGKPHLK